MCGIIGKIAPSLPDPRNELPLNVLRHRGPDFQGSWTDGKMCAIGHTRLAILDLDPRANQPMYDRGERFAIVFNGEVYNYKELAAEFFPGFRWKTNSDTEVVLELYRLQGPSFLNHLRGMFSFSIWDRQKNELFVARDRFGQKPFFYSFVEPSGSFFFASELPALQELVPFRPSISAEAIDLFLGYQFIPAPHTAFSEFKKLPPGCYGIWRSGSFSVQRYWEFVPTPNCQPASETEALNEMTKLVEESVSLRLRADVPVGVLLSGGIDSGVMTAVAAQNSTEPLHTFTIGFEEDRFNEVPFAEMVAARYGTRHTSVILAEKEAENLLLDVVELFGEPFGDKSALPALLVSQIAGNQVKVVLNGDGGDEAFCGYGKYFLSRPGDPATSGLPGSHVRGWTMEQCRSYFSENSLLDKAVRWMRREVVDPSSRVLHSEQFFRLRDRQEFYQQKFLSSIHGDPRWDHERRLFREANPRFDRVGWLQELDSRSYLAGDLLPKMDRTSMAHSLEVRSPFLDHRLAQWAAALPAHLKVAGCSGKLLLKKMAINLLPQEVYTHPKRGFSIPVSKWLNDGFREIFADLFSSPSHPLWEYLRPLPMKRLFKEHQAGETRHAYRLWLALLLGLWLDHQKGKILL